MKFLRFVGSIVCLLIVLYAGWISIRFLFQGRIPFAPVVFGTFIGSLGVTLLRSAFGLSQPDTELETQLHSCQSRYAEIFARLQELVLHGRPGSAELGFKIGDWSDSFLRSKQARLGSKFTAIVRIVRALQDANRRLSRVLYPEGKVPSRSQQFNALRKVRESLDQAEKSLGEASTMNATVQSDSSQTPPSLSKSAGPNLIVHLGDWDSASSSLGDDKV